MKRGCVLATAVAFCACNSGPSDPEPIIAVSTTPVEAPAPEEPPPTAEEPPIEPAPPVAKRPRLFPAKYRSLKLTRSVPVKAQAHGDSKNLGTIARDTRVRWKSARKGPGCGLRWIEIEPRGWVCEAYLRRSKSLPAAYELPRLERYERVPGRYGKVTVEGATFYKLEDGVLVESRILEGSAMVRRYGEEVIDDKAYWRIGDGELVLAEQVRKFRASSWKGTRLGDDTGWTLPIGIVAGRKSVNSAVAIYDAPEAGNVVRKVPARSPVPIVVAPSEFRPTAYQVGENEWVRGDELRLVERKPPPEHLVENERWFDIDLDRQVLVAYEGETPVYATLVSTGSRKFPTEAGIYRIWIKFAETAMSGQMGEEAPYSVATVPWTQYFSKDGLALHTSYWHNKFGVRRSHGCVNLAPADSRFLYFWSDPVVPAGWSMAHGTFESPGSIVRVRSRKDPNPPYRGYAKRVHKERVKRASVASN